MFLFCNAIAPSQRDLAFSGISADGLPWLRSVCRPHASGDKATHEPARRTDIPMIKLTRLDGEPFVLNAELIRYVERRPDTFVTLTSGERIVVSETMDEVVRRAVEYQQQKHFMPMPRVSNDSTMSGASQV